MVPETYIPKPRIPFTIGESIHQSLEAGQQSTLFLSAGRWALSPRSTVPFARVEVPQYGGREMTWSQIIEVPEGSQGTVTNSSFHKGDVVFDGCGTGVGFVNVAPSCVTVPAIFTTDAAGTQVYSNSVDTRRARRCYLCARSYASPDGPLNFFVFYQALRRGDAFDPSGFAVSNGGILSYRTGIYGYKKMVPLGFGSGENQEPAPGVNSIPELRPMAFLDSLYLRVALADFNSSGLSGSGDNYFLLEY